MNITFRQCVQENIEILCELSRRTYFETFAHLCTPSDMEAYLDEAYDRKKLCAELLDVNSSFYFLYAGEQLAGYLKLNEAPAQTDIHDRHSLEIERIYVAKGFQGQGLGGCLMDKAISMAKEMGKRYVWLGVWEKNIQALGFYKRNGFYKIGTHSFIMGDDKQTDYIMRKDL